MPNPPLGIKNNNYLNVKNGSSPWLDADGVNSNKDSKGHAVFKDPVYGIRAGILQLKSYYFKHNRRTVAEILARWAPSTDTIGSIPGAPPNSPAEYTRHVTSRMGVGPNDRLEIFDPVDQSLGNLEQLRTLFYAMASYEIGGDFKVPTAEFNAALELIEPGVRKDGTDDHATNTLLNDVAPTWTISGSVGAWEKDAKNKAADVKTVQAMLLQISSILHTPSYDPLGNDGKIAATASKSNTVKAIKSFQARFMLRPDGLIDPDGKTFREMLRILGTGSLKDDYMGEGGTTGCSFPFAQLPAKDWTTAPRSFASSRDNGKRAHAGCDLYFPAGTPIYAIADGIVIRGPYYFYSGTYALEVDHGTFIARYGEINGDAPVRTGDRVKGGQVIANVGHLVGVTVPSDMLHLELYDKTASGALSVPLSESAISAAGVPFLRRKDLIDPTAKLNQWQNNLPKEDIITPLSSKIPTKGFCIHLQRIREEKRSGMSFSRTIGNYQCYWNGAKINNLQGQIVERGGPGDNSTEVGDNQNRRIREGLYPLAIQEGSHYRTFGYTSGKTTPKPGILLLKTDERTAILLHPGEDYLSSVGCLNPTTSLTDANSKINFMESRERVIAIIDTMKSKMAGKFPQSGPIADAAILIEGEPT